MQCKKFRGAALCRSGECKQRERRPIGHEHQHDQQREQEPDHVLHHLSDGNAGDGGSHKQVDAIGRRAEADGEVHRQHDAKGDRTHAQRRHDGQQDRRENDGRWNVIHQAADNEQEQVDEYEEQDLVVGNAEHGSRQRTGNARQTEVSRERRGQADHECGRAVDNDGITQRLIISHRFLWQIEKNIPVTCLLLIFHFHLKQ